MQKLIFNLQKQFTVKDDIKRKKFYFNAKTNETNSYSVAYYECDSNLTNAWIVISKALKNDRPELIFE